MKKGFKKLKRSYMRSLVSTLSILALTIAVLLVIVLLVQDIFNQLWVAHASESIQNYRNSQMSNLVNENKQLKNRFNDVVSELFSDKEAKDWNDFILVARSIAPAYDYPVNVLLAQAALESNRGKSHFAKERNNYFGYNCNDGNEEKDCAWFSTPTESIIEYLRLIKRKYPKAYAARKTPELMIKEIKAGGYASDPNYVFKVMSVEEWKIK